MQLKDQIPNKKVGSGLGYGLPVAIILGWLIEEVGGVKVPPGVGEALGVIVGGIIAWAVPEKQLEK